MVMNGDPPAVRMQIDLLRPAPGIQGPAILFKSPDKLIRRNVFKLAPYVRREGHAQAGRGILVWTRVLLRAGKSLSLMIRQQGIGSWCLIRERR